MSNGWTPAAPCAPPTVYLPLGGGTMVGPLTLAADPVQPLDAATKQYVDAATINQGGIGDNRITNGDMRIDQRNNGVGTTPIAGAYVIDRWAFGATQAGKFNAQRSTAAVGGTLASLGFNYYLGFTSASAYTVLTGDLFSVRQPIEADMASDFAWGTVNAQPVTLSFIISSSLTGAFGGAISNNSNGATRSYPFTYSIPTASTWTKIAITIPGDTAGTWTLQGNGIGVCLHFSLGCGATFSALAGAWATGDYRSANGAVSIVSTNSAAFYVTGVKLEIGSVATPYNRQSLAKSMADCQRYYIGGIVVWNGGYATAGVGAGQSVEFPVTMRAAPTVNFGTVSATNSTGIAVSLGPTSVGFGVVANVSATGGYLYSTTTTSASAEL